uniref:Uncharacterized protein n=1 Tax=Cacopsylla melanoneura TaxID=428564 RepID=A0A8D9E6X8_9HEMI
MTPKLNSNPAWLLGSYLIIYCQLLDATNFSSSRDEFYAFPSNEPYFSVSRSDALGSKKDYNVPRSNFFGNHSSGLKNDSRAPRSLRGQFLEQMNEKCERESRSSPQSYIRSYCFQYNTLSHIHYLLSFGEELLQVRSYIQWPKSALNF